jgi:hypothetical protein
MSDTSNPTRASLTLIIPSYEYEVRSKLVRHRQLIRFLVEGVEHDEDAQAMIREFVEDLARAGIKEE